MVEPRLSGRSGAYDRYDGVELEESVHHFGETVDEARSSKLLRGPFLRLWLAQVTASLGDWVGLVAILALADRLGGGGSSGTSIGLVMVARMTPGFFLASVGGVLVDRWDRKRVMVLCNLGRAAILATLPFVDTLWGLVVASLALEVMTLLWSPAKEASVPNLVPVERLPTANSLSLAAAYGTFPLATALTAILFKVAQWLSRFDALDALQVNRESIALYFNVVTFLASALLIATLKLSSPERTHDGRINLRATFDELAAGWRFIGSSPVIKAVMMGLATGLFGGGMVVPLGIVFSKQVLGAGQAGFSLLLTALGFGVAAGVLALSAVQKHLPHERIFTLAVLGAGAFLMLAASTSTLPLAMVSIAVVGVCAGAVYVIGFTILHENVEDEFRGRIFATLYTLIRLVLLAALALAPFISELLGNLSRQIVGSDLAIEVGEVAIGLPGVRLTLWLGALFILAAGVLSAGVLRAAPAAPEE
ncbi:MAG: MFS transporter [Actinomycetota bacterium]|nr:MFS transporter [Actinomycetota bacterium]